MEKNGHNVAFFKFLTKKVYLLVLSHEFEISFNVYLGSFDIHSQRRQEPMISTIISPFRYTIGGSLIKAFVPAACFQMSFF